VLRVSVKKTYGLSETPRRKRGVDVHSTIERNPETLLKNWLEPIETRAGEVLPPPPPESKREAERFLAWLRARKSYSSNTLHRYLVEFRKLSSLSHAKLGKSVRELGFEDLLELGRWIKYPEVVKLWFRCLWEITGEEEYKRLYERLKVPGKRQRLPEALTREQVERLLEECGREDFELKVLVALIYETGARAGEILRLKGRDVEFDQYGARLWIRKSKSEARVVRVALYANLLAAWLEAQKPKPDEPIFTREYNAYLQKLAKVWERAGLPPTSRKFHILRHTRATELLKSRTFTEKEMMLWFGWRTRGMIDVYARVTMEDAERSYLASVKGVEIKKEEPPKPKACPRCGALNPPDASFCLKCAAPLTAEAEKQLSATEIMLQQLLAKLAELEKKLGKE
jgi:integrase/ribosomal protein L40E